MRKKDQKHRKPGKSGALRRRAGAKKGAKSPAGKARPAKTKRKKPLSKLDQGLAKHAAEINELVERGRPRGFVTDNEILYYFPNVEDNVALLDEVYHRLEQAGIK